MSGTSIEIARAYTQALRDARQMDITSIAPEKYTQSIKESYPFHPAIRDLYARFRENPGFQQTRGLIRLMRTIVSRLYSEDGRASQLYLIHAHDIDLNDRETLAQIASINPTLDNAISHDIESNGQAVAETLDANASSSDAGDASKLLLVSSLANIPNALLGLSISEIVANLCAPNRDITKLKDMLSVFSTQAWYLHSSRDGKLFFKNVQNLVAKLKTMADSYNQESSLRELRDFLSGTFAPTIFKDCYQDVLVLPALDEVNISQDKVTLILYEPCLSGLHPDLQQFYDDLEFKNRVLFLSGQRDTLNALQDVAREHRAIKYILDEMKKERLPETDPQYQMAVELQDKINLRLLSAARETFYTLIYPHGGQFLTADFYMNFTDNAYRGEQQIRETLKTKQKFTDDVSSDIFRKKCEQRLFTQKVMPWSEIKKRAAVNTAWQWHRVDALDNLKTQLAHQDQWREDSSGYVEKGPFPPPKTDVRIQELNRDDNTGEVAMKLTPLYGDSIHYEIGGVATGGSLQVDDTRAFKTCETEVSFLCVDSRGQHETGDSRWWSNRITLKHKIYQNGEDKMVELKAAPQAPIRYTTDGSSPKTSGGAYVAPFIVPRNAPCVLAVAEKGKVCSELKRIDIDWKAKGGFKLDTSRPVFWNRMHSSNATKDTYELMDLLGRFDGLVPGPRITVSGQSWVELSFDSKMMVGASELRKSIEYLRSLVPDGQVVVEAERIKLPTGQHLLDWVAAAKTELKPEEVQQL